MPITRFITGDPSGGSAPTDLTLGAATDPEQSLASDATTATVEWPTASGGTSPYTYAISVKDEAGSSVTPDSGSANGPYVIPVAAGKSYSAMLGVTDAAGQVARRTAMVHVAAETGTVGWVKTHDLDFAGVTPVTQTSASGSGTLSGGDFDGIPYKWNRPTGTAGSVAITEDGMKLTGMASGSYEAHVDLSTLVNASDDDDFVVAIFVRDIAGINASTEGIRIGISASGTLASGTNDGMKSNYASAGNWTPNIMRNDTTTTSYGGTVAIPVDGRLTVRLRSGLMAHSAWAAGSSVEPDDAAIDALFLHQISFSAKAAEPYSTGLWVGASAYNGADVTVEIYRVCIYKRGVV